MLESLGPSVKILKDQAPRKKFSVPTAFKIGLQLLSALEALHDIGYVHNDLKFENICVGSEDMSKTHLIDFGLSQRFYDDKGKHIKRTNLKKFSGNFIFASMGSCHGFNKSRKDDIESLLYMIIFLINQDNLPWTELGTLRG